MKIFVMGYLKNPEVQAEILRLQPLLSTQFIVRHIDLSETASNNLEPADLALVLGGDGTILRAAHVMGEKQLPTLGINLGKLGFLADVKQRDAGSVLSQLFQHGFEVSEHLMLQCVVTGTTGTRTLLGLNEMVVHADPPLQ